MEVNVEAVDVVQQRQAAALRTKARPSTSFPRPNLTFFGASMPEAYVAVRGCVQDGLLCERLPRAGSQEVARQGQQAK